MAKRLTRHNGRAGKGGVYKATHNDRSFHTEHADHIDGERIQRNIYWDCFRGATYPAQRDREVSFADVEKSFYLNRYSDYLDGQHERNCHAISPIFSDSRIIQTEGRKKRPFTLPKSRADGCGSEGRKNRMNEKELEMNEAGNEERARPCVRMVGQRVQPVQQAPAGIPALQRGRPACRRAGL